MRRLVIVGALAFLPMQAMADLVPGGVGAPANFPSGMSGAAIETKHQRKDLPLQLDGTAANAVLFTFNNLVIGKTYRINVALAINTTPSGATAYKVTVEHNASVLSTAIGLKADNTTAEGMMISDDVVFVAAATTATVVGADAGSTVRLLVLSHVYIEEAPNLVITTDFT